MTKKIGFIDFFLDEWHSNNYPAWIRDNVAATGREMEVAYAWAQTSPPGKLDTTAWCNKYQVQELDSMEELIERSDYLIVFSPDNPERHEELCELPLKSGKPTYVDKTFSPDLASGIRIFDLAEKHGTPMFSCSALRCALELAAYPNERVNRSTLQMVATFGPGVFANYAVHQFEMSVALLGPGAARVKAFPCGASASLVVEYADGRQSSMLQMPGMPFHLSMQLASGEGVYVEKCSDIFPRLIEDTLAFFETGKPPVPREETLEIMALIEAGRKAIANPDSWVQV